MIKETCECPYCKTVLDVEEYGYDLECSKCKGKLEVFPDTDIWINSKFGNIEITGLDKYLNLFVGKSL